MDPIPVPAPAPEAFNKQRPPSDLLLSQLTYFQHLDEKHDHGIDPAIAGDVGTEAGVARYIAAMTRSIRKRALEAGKGTISAGKKRAKLKVVAKPAADVGEEGGLAIAAAAEPEKANAVPAKKAARGRKKP